jgi:hypothetical protein
MGREIIAQLGIGRNVMQEINTSAYRGLSLYSLIADRRAQNSIYVR